MGTIMNFSVFFKLLTYRGDGSIISAIAVPPCSEPVPLRIFWSGYGPGRTDGKAISLAECLYMKRSLKRPWSTGHRPRQCNSKKLLDESTITQRGIEACGNGDNDGAGCCDCSLLHSTKVD